MNWLEILKQHWSGDLILLFHRAFGTVATKKFIDLFGGLTFRVPTWTEINRKSQEELYGGEKETTKEDYDE